MREQTAQTREAIKRNRGCRKRTSAGEVHTAVGFQELGPDDTGLRMGFETGQQSGYPARRHQNVRIQDQNVSASRRPQGLVVAKRETTVARRANESRPWKFERDHVGRTVARSVVDDDRFGMDRSAGPRRGSLDE